MDFLTPIGRAPKPRKIPANRRTWRVSLFSMTTGEESRYKPNFHVVGKSAMVPVPTRMEAHFGPPEGKYPTQENTMTKLFAILALAIAIPMSNPAHAFIKCDKMDDAKKQKKCEKNTAKSLAKQRANSTAYAPSNLGEAFAGLDGDDNPFNSDDFYLGESTSGIKKVDAFSAQVNQVAATVRMAKYVGHLNKTDAAAAAKLGGALLPKLIALKDEAPKIVEEGQALVGDAANLVESPMDVPKALKALGGSVATVTKAVGDLPGAITAIQPIAGGAAASAISGAMDKAAGAVQQATDAASEAAGAVDDAKGAISK